VRGTGLGFGQTLRRSATIGALLVDAGIAFAIGLKSNPLAVG